MSTCGVDSCDRRHCVVCGRRHLEPHEPQTCVYCLGRVRSDLARIVEAYALLPAELVDGGRGQRYDRTGPRGVSDGLPDALVMLADGRVAVDGFDPAFELLSDPVPPVPLLAHWEDDWRHLRRLAAAGPATMASVTGFLDDNLGWAAQHHPAFDEFASEVRRLRGRIEAVTRVADPVDVGVGCPDCGEPLTRRYRDPAPCEHAGPHMQGCDQGGREEDWTCGNRECGRTRVTPREYWMAVAAAYDRLADA